LTGRVKDFALKHDASRVIQTGLKYGNLEQRKMIAREIKGHYCELAQSKFAKHLIGKILVHGDSETRDLVIPEFFGNVRKLMKHPEAAWILDDVYRGAATTQQKAVLLREWYGAEYAIFKSGSEKVSSNLSQILKESPEKRTPIMRYLFDFINQLIQKKTTGFTILHDAMLEYYINVVGTELAVEFLEVVKGDEEGDLLKNLAFTASGSRLVCLLLAHGNAKDRKLLLRAYKGVIQTMAFDAHAHKVLLVALNVVDDTVLTTKTIYSELLPKPSDSEEAIKNAHSTIIDYALDLHARAAVLYPFVHKQQSILPPGTDNILSEVNNIRKETSKKDPEVRRKELAKAIASQLLAVISTHALDLLRQSFGCQFITETILGSTDGIVDDEVRLSALDAIINVVQDNDVQDVISSPPVGRLLKTLVLSGWFNPKLKIVEVSTPLGFADKLFEVIDIPSWATGNNSFVIVGLTETTDFKKRERLMQILKDNKKPLKKAANQEKPNKGAQVLLGKLDS
jgi:pumilio homology domain family member 6